MIKIKNKSQRAFIALTLSFLPVFFVADLAHAQEEPVNVSVTLTADEQITQAEITLTSLTSQIEVVAEDLSGINGLVEKLVDGGSSNLASINEIVSTATLAVEEASLALDEASDALWDAKEKQDAYKLAVAASELADSNLSSAQSEYSEAVVNLSSISAAVALQQNIVTQEQAELNAMQGDGYAISSPGWTGSAVASSSSSSTVILPEMYDASTKIDVPFDIKMGNTLYEGQGSASQIYVTSKAFISFGQPDHTFWDWPQTTGIYVYQSDWMTAGTGAYTKVTTTENTLTVEWSLHRFGDHNGPLTNVIWNMVVDPATGEWTGYSQISGNTENLYGGPRIGVRYSNGATIESMSPVAADSESAELIQAQQEVVANETAVLVDLTTQKNLQTVVVQNKNQFLATANAVASQSQAAEIQALQEFSLALESTLGKVENTIIVVNNAQTSVNTAYLFVSNEINSLSKPEYTNNQPDPAETTEPEPTEVPEPTPTEEPDQTPKPTEPEVLPEPSPEPSLEPSPEPTPLPEPEPSIPEQETPTTEELVDDLLSDSLDPKSLTEDQIEQVKELANEIFKTAEPGSKAYEQALDLLMVAAQADDPELPEELAAIPLIGNVAAAALEVFNNVGNIGADMSPEVREKSEKVVIASVIAAQAAIGAVAAASASTTASSGTRRI